MISVKNNCAMSRLMFRTRNVWFLAFSITDSVSWYHKRFLGPISKKIFPIILQ